MPVEQIEQLIGAGLDLRSAYLRHQLFLREVDVVLRIMLQPSLYNFEIILVRLRVDLVFQLLLKHELFLRGLLLLLELPFIFHDRIPIRGLLLLLALLQELLVLIKNGPEHFGAKYLVQLRLREHWRGGSLRCSHGTGGTMLGCARCLELLRTQRNAILVHGAQCPHRTEAVQSRSRRQYVPV